MGLRIQENVSLSSFTTFKTGGVARYFAAITSLSDINTALDFAEQKQVPYFILGSGSNLLAPDNGYPGLLLHITLHGVAYQVVDENSMLVRVAAGEILDDVIRDTTERGLWGLENLSHIPGTVGATPVQNVGAYGVEVSSCIKTVVVFDCREKCIREFTNEQCQFDYRDSLFKQSGYKHLIIVSVTFILSRIPMPQVAYADLAMRFKQEVITATAVRSAVIAIRAAKFPDWQEVGTAGSFFKNPIISRAVATSLLERYPGLPTYAVTDTLVKVPLGYILDKICGLRGYQVGLCSLYESQALVLIAKPGSTTNMILAFAEVVAAKVREKTGIEIEREVLLMSE